MSLFGGELLPFDPPRYRSRVGDRLSRYGRARQVPDAACRAPSDEAPVRACAAPAGGTHPLPPMAVDAAVSMAA